MSSVRLQGGGVVGAESAALSPAGQHGAGDATARARVRLGGQDQLAEQERGEHHTAVPRHALPGCGQVRHSPRYLRQTSFTMNYLITCVNIAS